MESLPRQIGIAVCGCGYWGINYVRVFHQSPEARIVAICDLEVDRLRQIGRQFPGVNLYSDVERVLRRPDVDAVVVCTPVTTHYALARRCLEAGKHVLIEKPITAQETEAEALIELAETKNLVLMVGHTFLYNAGVHKVKSYIEQGQIGRLYYLYSRRTNLGPIRHDVNALWDLAPHDISIFNFLLNSTPIWVSAVGGRVLQTACEDFGFISLGYENDVVGHIHVSWTDPNKVREVVVVGSDQRIVFDDVKTTEQVRVYEKGVTLPEVTVPSYGEYRFLIRDGDIISPKVEVSEPLKNQCRHFLESVVQGSRPLTDGWAGLQVVGVMKAVDRSVKLNGAPVLVRETMALTSNPEIAASVWEVSDGAALTATEVAV